MRFYSTNRKASKVDFKTALLRGLAEDGGLYMPTKWAKISNSQFLPPRTKQNFRRQDSANGGIVSNFSKFAARILKRFTDIPEKDLEKVCAEVFNFPVSLAALDEDLYILELFHGPTLSFKDFGARFMARVMSYYTSNLEPRTSNKKGLNIIVATSGDTGSAVAQGFYGLSNIKVFVLYPSKRISKLQEKQIATLGKNIVALEAKGDFDDCQRLAKQALADDQLRKKINLSSANSINIGRLLPQMVYYFESYRQYLGLRKTYGLAKTLDLPVFVVPSGNFGNLVAGLFSKKIGLPVKKFIAAVNINSGVPEYLKTGKSSLKKTAATISNAMDVGNPSNWARVIDFYRDQSRTDADRPLLPAVGRDMRGKIQKDLEAITVTDGETKKIMRDIYKKYNYICDPHTAVGVAAALKSKVVGPKIVLATAHPAKFKEIVEKAIGKTIKLPRQLSQVQKKKKQSIVIEPTEEAFYKIFLNGENIGSF